MSFKGYYHRYGTLTYDEFDTLEEAKSVIEWQEDMGECFPDCIVDEKGIIVHDFDTDRVVFGREKPKSRVGKQFGTNQHQ